ncbi:hypothetical protein RN22_15845 [Grimontia sp. AD028]|uniref:choice-of-anchor A family protein n=1 Tax=Grimontia sp. AD028 TaxID=1581149 RepID=UPI00061AB948|nr:choice-of-anchor A family protein [Grimontia sp. AD028]KKD59389.1 hypothetical protein RN22_15845 [Grimontia sp. AD028]
MKKILGILILTFAANTNAITNDYSALIFGNFSSPHSSSEGPLAVAGNASLNGYSILYGEDSFPATSHSLIVGGDLNYVNGRLYQGSGVVGGDTSNVSESIYLGLANGSTITGYSDMPIDFNALENKHQVLSNNLSKLDSNGSVTLQWGGLYLEGDCLSDVQVFNLDGFELEKAHSIYLQCIPDEATIIVNISGDKPDFKPLSNISLSDFSPHKQKAVFNIFEATSLSLSGVSIEGLVLSPYADIVAPSGSSNVGIIANSWKGSMSLGYLPFNGQLPTPTLNTQLKWHWSGSSIFPDFNQVMMTPVVGQLNDDNGDGEINHLDVADIVITSFNGSNYAKPGIVRALSGVDGSDLWNYEDGAIFADPRYSPAIADVDNDGLVEVIVANREDKFINILSHSGRIKKQIERYGRSVSNIGVSDINQDGIPEILNADAVYSSDTGFLFSHAWSPSAISFKATNASEQVIFAGGNLYDSVGQLLWSHPKGKGAWFSAVADTDGNGTPELIVSVPGSYNNSHYFALVDEDGTVIWELDKGLAHGGGVQAISAFLEDGDLGIAYSGYKSVDMHDVDGNLVWTREISDGTSGKIGVSAFDFDADGSDELIIQDQLGVQVLHGATGESLLSVANSSATLWEYPILVDLEGDDNAELIVVSNDYDSRFNTHRGVRVFESNGNQWKNATRIWNQHSYHQTNITQDGKIPQYEMPSWLLNNTYRSSTLR